VGLIVGYTMAVLSASNRVEHVVLSIWDAANGNAWRAIRSSALRALFQQLEELLKYRVCVL
jgi:hypothetical protein